MSKPLSSVEEFELVCSKGKIRHMIKDEKDPRIIYKANKAIEIIDRLLENNKK